MKKRRAWAGGWAWLAALLGVALVGCGSNRTDAGSDAATTESGSPPPPSDAGGDAGLDTSCFGPPLTSSLAIHTAGGADFSTDDGWVALSGSAPVTIGPILVNEITVNGSSRFVSYDPAASIWSYHGPLEVGPNLFEVRARAGAKEEGPVAITVSLTSAPAPETRATFAGVHRSVRDVGLHARRPVGP